MLLNENWRAWHRRLLSVSVIDLRKFLSCNGREVSGSFFMLCLLFCQEPRQRHDLSIDPLLTNSSAFAISIHGSHVCQLINAAECQPKLMQWSLKDTTDVKPAMRRMYCTGVWSFKALVTLCPPIFLCDVWQQIDWMFWMTSETSWTL